MHAIHPTRRHAAQLLLPGRPLLPTDLYSSRLLVLGDDDGRSGEVIGSAVDPVLCRCRRVAMQATRRRIDRVIRQVLTLGLGPMIWATVDCAGPEYIYVQTRFVC